ncbi:MAG: tRNA (adenosine(37)-N6)-threonylcarbamoyltransferase complex dimerization subunit type 1 TsaB [Candidatus Marinimicrobia bacterium]|nr:tRNA (adenosine(37)-N6)-threonylcarbamoyltransferase complex dimerization subunit type 1 TsaB [Candidatus Neomarinimicrobiota bacterium]
MNILAIESASTICGTAIFLEGKLTEINEIEQPRIHGEKLPLMVQNLLHSHSITVHDLDGIAISSGPGSYTGLRIGMSLAKGLAATANLPLIPVSTLKGMHYGLGKKDGIWVALHSHKDMVFLQQFEGEHPCSEIVCESFDRSNYFPLAGFNLDKLCVEDEYMNAPPSAEYIGKLAILNFNEWAEREINTVIPNYVTNFNIGVTRSS